MARIEGLRPMLQVENIAETISFYTDKLGFTCTTAAADEKGEPHFAALTRGAERLTGARCGDASAVAKSMTTAERVAFPGGVGAEGAELLTCPSSDDFFRKL